MSLDFRSAEVVRRSSDGREAVVVRPGGPSTIIVRWKDSGATEEVHIDALDLVGNHRL